MPNTMLLMNQARASQARGEFAAAARSYESVLRLDPRHFEAAYAFAVACYQAGQLERAAAGFAAAATLNPRRVEPHKDRGLVLMKLGQHDAARESFEAAVRLLPGSPELLLNLGLARKNSGRIAESVESYEAALRLKPGYAEAHNNLANSLSLLGRHEEALAAATRAVAAGPTSARARLTRAGILEVLGRASEAIDDCTVALALEPRNREALLAKARLLSAASRHAEVITLCDLAIAIDPADARAYYRIGRALEAVKDLAAAAKSYGKAAELDPSSLSALNRHAAALAQLRRHEEALACYDRLVAQAPGKPSHWSARGALKAEMGQQEDGLDDIGQALRITSGGHRAAEATAEACIRLLSVDKIPAIYRSEAECAATRARVEAVLDDLVRMGADQPPATPEQTRVAEQAIRHLTGFYLAYHQRNDRETMRKLSLAAARLLSPTPFAPAMRRSRDGRIRVGIASQRLRDHNGANWAYNWFARLPQDDYEIFTYNFEAATDALAVKFAALGTHRAFSQASNPQDIIAQMRDDDLGILMLPDVGMTAVSRYLSLHRIAPCQFTAWGHPVTTGSPEIDCYLSSDLMEPEDAQEHYTEELVRMPNLALYLEEEGLPPASTPVDFGLPEDRVLYGCLQSLFKYLPRHDGILPRIAASVPDALFVFVEAATPYVTAVMRERLENAFAAEGLDAARHVVFLPRQTPRGFDGLMQAMDVLVDSLGWSGGNTTLSGIAMGKPLVTREGRFMRGRHSSAMFRLIGAEEMIAASDEDYVAILVGLGQDEARRRHCSGLFEQGRHRLYRDGAFILAFDRFLKQRGAWQRQP